VADQASRDETRPQLLRHASGERPRRNPARLGVPDQACGGASSLQAQLRQLGGLPRPGCAADDDDRMSRERLEYLRSMGSDGKSGVVVEPQIPLQHSAAHLVQLDGLEQSAEIALAEPLVALALDDLEEDRTDDILREDLQQHALSLARIAVDENAPLLQLAQRLAMTGHAGIARLIISIRRALESHALAAQDVPGAIDVLRTEGDVLNALATVFAQILLDLTLVVLGLVDRDTDLAARTGHRAREQARVLSL